MIGEGPSLIEILPPRLKEALDRELHEGEEVKLAVRGNPREALAATTARLLTLREGSSSLDPVTVEAYPLAEVTGLTLREAGAETAVTWSQVGRAEPAVFSVPSYDAGKFRRVAEVVRGLLPAGAGASSGATNAGAAPNATRCPRCGTTLPADGAFCPACGLQSRDLCWECGRPLETEWRFCPSCGEDSSELGVIPCPSCRAPVARDHAYCVQCGTAARPTCDECDRLLRRSWRHCPDCGAPVSEEGSGAATGTEPAYEVQQSGRRRGAAATEPQESTARAQRREGPATPFPEPGDVRPSGSASGAEEFNQKGIEAYERERFAEAVELFRQAVARDPSNAMFHCNLAVACGEAGLDDQAFAEYQRTLALDPANVTALVNLGYLYSEQERYEEARDCWERAIRAAPESAEAAEARENLQSLEQL